VSSADSGADNIADNSAHDGPDIKIKAVSSAAETRYHQRCLWQQERYLFAYLVPSCTAR
jgi:hypothetical protein